MPAQNYCKLPMRTPVRRVTDRTTAAVALSEPLVTNAFTVVSGRKVAQAICRVRQLAIELLVTHAVVRGQSDPSPRKVKGIARKSGLGELRIGGAL